MSEEKGFDWSKVHIKIPGVFYVTLIVAIGAPLSQWLTTYVSEPLNYLLVILLAALIKAVEVAWGNASETPTGAPAPQEGAKGPNTLRGAPAVAYGPKKVLVGHPGEAPTQPSPVTRWLFD